MFSASTQTYMTCPGASGTGMPQVKLVRLIERSRKPPRTKLMTSLRREDGRMKSGCDSYRSSSLSCHFDRSRKYEGSLTHSTGAPDGAVLVPSGRVVSSSSS